MKSYTLIEKAFLLKKIPIFAALELDHLLPIADKLTPGAVDAEQIIFDFDEPAYSMYLIVNGIVIVDNGLEGPLYRISKEDFFGEEAAISGLPRAYRAKSESHVEFFTLSRSNLLTIMREYPSIAIALLETFSATIPFRPRGLYPES